LNGVPFGIKSIAYKGNPRTCGGFSFSVHFFDILSREVLGTWDIYQPDALEFRAHSLELGEIGLEVGRPALPDTLRLIENQLAVALEGNVVDAAFLGEDHTPEERQPLSLIVRPIAEAFVKFQVKTWDDDCGFAHTGIGLASAVEIDFHLRSMIGRL
jgi:hypothetical protein